MSFSSTNLSISLHCCGVASSEPFTETPASAPCRSRCNQGLPVNFRSLWMRYNGEIFQGSGGYIGIVSELYCLISRTDYDLPQRRDRPCHASWSPPLRAPLPLENPRAISLHGRLALSFCGPLRWRMWLLCSRL